MKKLFIVALAAIGMVACVQNEVVDVVKSDAIVFDDAFISNSTRAAVGDAIDPSFTEQKANLTAFNVWGFMNENDGTVFSGNEVTYNGSAWVYDDIQYWMPGNHYYFAAVAPVGGNWEAVNGDTSNLYPVDIINFINADGTEDLLYVYNDEVVTPTTGVQDMQAVDLHFQHLLSKVKFTFQNTFATSNVKVEVKDIKMAVPTSGSINLVKNEWEAISDSTFDLLFGTTNVIEANQLAEAQTELLTIPTGTDYTYNITFTVDVYQGAAKAYTVEKTSTLTGLALEMGKAYNFTATIGPDVLDLKPIEFEVIVEDWVNALTPDKYVSETELLADIQLSDRVTMSGNVELTNSPLVINKDLVLDLGGFELKGAIEVAEGSNATVTILNGKVTNDNEDINAITSWSTLTLKDVEVSSARHCVRMEAGDLVVDGGTYKAVLNSGSTVYALNIGNAGVPTTALIKGDVFVGPQGTAADSGAAMVVKADAVVNVEGGDFYGGKLNTIVNNGTLIISGGIFDQEPKAEWLAEGYGVAYRESAIYGKKGYVVVPQVVADLAGVTEETTVDVTADVAVAAGTTIHTQDATAPITINGNGNSIVSTSESAADFQWVGGTIPAMSTIFSSVDGAKVTVNDLNFEGTMSALMLGNYVNSSSNWFNTELNNVNVIDTEVMSFSSNISPAVCVYGTAVLNNCNIYGTTLSELDTDPMWPVYDLAAVNYSNTTINGGKIGSVYLWNQAELVIDNGAEVETLIVRGNMNTSKYGVTIKAGTTVGTIDLSAITTKTRVNFTIEEGANVGKVVANGVEYPSVAAYTGSVEVADSAGLENAIKNGVEVVIVEAGEYDFPTTAIQDGVSIIGKEGAVLNVAGNSIKSDNVVIKGFEIRNNGQSSAALRVSGKNPVIEDCVFTGAAGNGQGIVVAGNGDADNVITLKNCDFSQDDFFKPVFDGWSGLDGGTLVMDGCKLANGLYTMHIDANGESGTIIVKNSLVSGFTTNGASLDLVSFENCTFGETAGYACVNVYTSHSFVNCTFPTKADANNVSNYGLYCSSKAAGKDLTIKNCKMSDGTVLDASNVAVANGGFLHWDSDTENMNVTIE